MKYPWVTFLGVSFLGVGLLAGAALLGAQGRQTFTGAVTDDECFRADHSRMRMGPTDAQCAIACVEGHGVQFVLF